jgi:hypothetical protein
MIESANSITTLIQSNKDHPFIKAKGHFCHMNKERKHQALLFLPLI